MRSKEIEAIKNPLENKILGQKTTQLSSVKPSRV